MLYFPLFQKAEEENDVHKNYVFLLQHFLLFQEERARNAAAWGMGRDLPTDTPKHPACLEGDQQCQDPMGPWQLGSTLGGLCWKGSSSPTPCTPLYLVSRPQLVPVMMLLLLQQDEPVSEPCKSLPMAFSSLVFKPSPFYAQ